MRTWRERNGARVDSARDFKHNNIKTEKHGGYPAMNNFAHCYTLLDNVVIVCSVYV